MDGIINAAARASPDARIRRNESCIYVSENVYVVLPVVHARAFHLHSDHDIYSLHRTPDGERQRRAQSDTVRFANLATAITSNGSNRNRKTQGDESVEKQQRLNELADFLRTRRARLRPEDIDFPSGPR